jgi:UPF0716 protein FxsA
MQPILIPLAGILGLILLEIFGFAFMGALIGPFLTVVVVVATAVGGLWIIRVQGASQLVRIQRSVDAGELPALELMATALLPVAAILLVFPGLFTDLIGLLLLIPPVRETLAREAIRRWGNRVRSGQTQAAKRAAVEIEGEFRRRDPERLRGKDPDSQ